MLFTKLLFVFASLAFVAEAYYNEHCGNCYDQCFLNCPRGYARECSQIYDMISRLRMLKNANFHDGVAFVFDGTEDSAAHYSYQRKLAALAALTLPVGLNKEECDIPLYFSQYHEWYGYVGSLRTIDNSCQDTCQFYDFLMYSPTLVKSSEPAPTGGMPRPVNWPANGCRMTKKFENELICPSSRVMLVQFVNSVVQADALPFGGPPIPVGWQWDYCKTSYPWTRAVVQIRPTLIGSPEIDYTPSALANFPMFYTSALDQAADHLTQCIKDHCCKESGHGGGPSWPGGKRWPKLLYMTLDSDEIQESDNPEETLARLAEEEREYIESGRAQEKYEAYMKESGSREPQAPEHPE